MAEDLSSLIVSTDLVIYVKVITIAAGAMVRDNNILQTSIRRARGDVRAPSRVARDKCVLRETRSESCQRPSNPSLRCISVVHLELRRSDVTFLSNSKLAYCAAHPSPQFTWTPTHFPALTHYGSGKHGFDFRKCHMSGRIYTF